MEMLSRVVGSIAYIQLYPFFIEMNVLSESFFFFLLFEILQGALLNDDESKMIGSMLVLDYDTIEQVESHIAADPYKKANVWKRVDIRPLRLARLKTE
jgi:hypothetical protein